MIRSGRIRRQFFFDEIAHGDLAFAFQVRRTSFQTHDVGLLQLELGKVPRT